MLMGIRNERHNAQLQILVSAKALLVPNLRFPGLWESKVTHHQISIPRRSLPLSHRTFASCDVSFNAVSQSGFHWQMGRVELVSRTTYQQTIRRKL